jgi:hypothetical protein
MMRSKCTFTGAVGTEHADFGAGVEREVDPFQELFVINDLAQVMHRENVFVRHGRALSQPKVHLLALFGGGFG